jgi:hypothetical protein
MANCPTTRIAPIGEHTASSIAARLDRLPVTGWRRRMVVLIGLGSFCNLFEIALGSFLGVLLGAQWSLSTLDRSMVIGALFLGEMIGSLLLAPLADRFGRRLLFQVNLLTYAVGGDRVRPDHARQAPSDPWFRTRSPEEAIHFCETAFYR